MDVLNIFIEQCLRRQTSRSITLYTPSPQLHIRGPIRTTAHIPSRLPVTSPPTLSLLDVISALEALAHRFDRPVRVRPCRQLCSFYSSQLTLHLKPPPGVIDRDQLLGSRRLLVSVARV